MWHNWFIIVLKQPFQITWREIIKLKTIFSRSITRATVVKLLLLAGLLLLLGYIAASIFYALFYTTVINRSLGQESPASYGLTFEEVTFPSAAPDKLKLRGWWVPNPNSKQVLIMVHGQNQTRTALLPLSKGLWDSGYSLLFFDLRGHGQSDGDHHTFGYFEQWDTVGAADFVRAKGFGPDSIGAIGWSMGGPTALMAMSQSNNIKAAVSDSGYANLRPLHHHDFLYPGILLASRLLRDYDPEQIQPGQAITRLGTRHVFLIHGAQDTLIPVSEFEELKKLGGANVTQSWLVAGAGHISSFSKAPDEYLRRVVAFFKEELQ